MSIRGKHIFVSGGAGVIGLEIVPRLIMRGAIVMVGDLKFRPNTFTSDVIYRQGDLNTMTSDELAQFQPEIFIHLAATFERSAESYEFWEENFWHNVRLSHYLMTLVKDFPSLRRVVFASSYLIYDPRLYQFNKAHTQIRSLKESDSILPRNLTGMAKLSHEIELRFINQFKSKQFTTICARIYRGYGCNSRDIISRWIRDLLQKKALTVYRPEGIFDYIYAGDSAEGLIRLAENNEVDGIINLGTGKSRQVQDVLNILKQHFPDIKINEVESEIPFEASQADMSHYLNQIGWLPSYTLETAIPKIIEFERKRIEESLYANPKIPIILVSSASRKIPLIQAMQRSARKVHPDAKVIAGDLSTIALSCHVADDFWCMPPTKEVYLAELIQGCKERGITTILPTRDGELLFWAKSSSVFAEAGIQVIVASEASLETCIDKLAFANFGKSHALPFIPTETNIESVTATAYVVKERFGSGSRSIGINLDRKAAQAYLQKLDQGIIQPYIEGIEISVDAWLNRNHKVKGVILRRRELVTNGESQVTTTFRDVNIEIMVIKVLETLKLSGPVVLQAIITKQNQLQIIECNARFGGASTTAIAAGLDSLYWSLLESLSVNVDDYPFTRISSEIKQVRIPSDLHFTA
ncbi:NAD-dependent epimerase/dehydratase family protein [Thiolinea disciformis]|uniref:NAD-dependent epimerase/dehydratase family protein n=1 Tax=Thiolinea disciformis TaxID=125614 RepID=UPI00037997F3|nr:NAD-dependent epimerase/dehydratase family protein [Thiolinea disciformis]